MLLECFDVSYTYMTKYQKVEALNDVSVSFEAGKMYAIIGKSGSGKSTLLSVLAGLNHPTNGDVLFQGTTTKEMNLQEYRRKHISLIYQDFNLFPRLTALENVKYILELNGIRGKESKEQAKKLLLDLDLKEHCFHHFPQQLSGGEQQRVAIARTLGAKADILLADEPTGNLDVKTGNEIIEVFSKLVREKNICVIIVTHDLSIARKADCVYKMEDGQLEKLQKEEILI